MTDPSVTEQDARRAELIADLRAFADWLEQNPWLPLPSTIEARAAADPDHGRTTAVAEAKPDTLGIAMGRAAVPQMQTRPQCSPQCLTAYALKSIAFNQHLDGCPNAVSRPDSAVISPAAES